MTASLARGETGSESINGALRASYAVADLPPAVAHAGRILYCTNGAAGSPCIAVSNGTAWLRVALGAAVAAS